MHNTVLKYLFFLMITLTLFVVSACDPALDAKASNNKIVQNKNNPGQQVEERYDDTDTDLHGSEEEGEEEGHNDVVQLSPKEIKEFNIKLSVAGPGSIATFVDLPGEIVINTDTMVHVVPRVGGIVGNVNNKLGDNVEAGEVLATLESRDLAEFKVNYLSSVERFNLAKEIFSREEKLWKQQISAEQEFLTTKQGLAEARINLRSAEQKLHALGFSEEHLAQQKNHPDQTFTTYLVKAPFSGTIIEKHVTLGESVKDDSEIFIIADLSTVWVDISIYQKDLPLISTGQLAVIDPGHGLKPARGKISYLGPIVGETTRTALARIEMDNSNGKWRPGMFITARIAITEQTFPIVVPNAALQNFEGNQVVFVQDEDGFEPHPVTVGLSNQDMVEIIGGLTAGERYVSAGSFTLKAQLSKGAFGDGHNH